MTHRESLRLRSALNTAVSVSAVILLGVLAHPLFAQKADLQARVADLKESTEKNKKALAQYTWVEDLTIFLKGQERKTEQFQVRTGPDGKPQKTPLNPTSTSSEQSSGRRGRLRQRVVERKKEEFEDYAERMKSLAQRYIPPDKDAIQDAYAKGYISITPSAGAPNQIKLVIQNYVKPNDSMTLLLDKDQKQLMSIKIASYLDEPSDAMNLTVDFGRLPDGTSHVSNASIEGVSKQLTVKTKNSDYHKL
jgi:hypothetical protein